MIVGTTGMGANKSAKDHFSRSGTEGCIECGRRRKPMKIRTIIAATCAALAFSMAGPISAHDSEAETITKNFEAVMHNIPSKSLIAVEVDYPK
jgi:hypothetical protein